MSSRYAHVNTAEAVRRTRCSMGDFTAAAGVRDDLAPGDLVFDGKRTPMLVWHEHYPVGRGWRSGWVLRYDTDGKGNPDDYIVGLGLPDVDAAVAQAREYMRSVGYPLTGWPS